MVKSGVWMSAVLSVSLLLVLSFASPVLAATYFQEDFNSYTTNAELWAVWPKANLDELFTQEGDIGGGFQGDYSAAENADWGLNSLAGNRGNPPDRTGSATTGQCLASDSDHAGSDDNGNAELGYAVTSPAFSTSGGASTFLHFSCDAVLNDNGGPIFDVYVSGNNGASWTLVYQRIGAGRLYQWGGYPDPTPDNADAVYGVVDIDISSVAANKSQVKVRFINRGNSDDWFILIDDVIVDNIEFGIAGSTELMATETFSSAPVGGLPTGWSMTSGCNENPWQVGDLERYYTTAGMIMGRTINRLDEYFALFDSDKDPDSCADAEFLMTPAVNTTGYSLVYLIFDSELVTNTNASERVEVSTDNGANWLAQPVWNYNSRSTNGEDITFTHHVVPVYGIGGFTQVRFRFAYTGPGNSWFWAIDNVRILGGGGDLPPAAPSVSNPTTTFALDVASSASGCTGFTTSAFNPAAGETHGRTEFQVIASTGSFDRPLLTGAVTTGDLTKFDIIGIGSPATYLVRARHITAGGTPGAYGDPFTFTVGGPTGTIIALSENFDSVAGLLQPAFDELAGVGCTNGIADASSIGWTHTPPTGWTIDNSLMGQPPGVGVDEWYGWCFTTVPWWDDAGGGQLRADFTKSTGVMAVCDPDEWDDCDSAASGGAFNSILISPAIQVPAGKKVTILFDNFYRQESSPGLMEGQLLYSANGGADVVMIHYCYNGGEGCADNPGATSDMNISTSRTIAAFPSATSLVFKWMTFNGANDWYWAIDNIFVFVEGVPTSIEEWSQY